MQTAIPFIFMRAGTSRGLFFNKKDLPDDRQTLSKILTTVVGSADPLNINGLGGGNAVTTKVAILSQAQDDWGDIDYFFAQVAVDKEEVDYKPTCGNILSGVAAAAVEMGLFKTTSDYADIKINAVNTGARVISSIHLKDGMPLYGGDAEIAGVTRNASPVTLKFMDVAGSVTGALLPTGNAKDTIDGIDVTCMDIAMPVVIAKAEDFGIKGDETAESLNENKVLFDKMEKIRLQAGKMMGMGDVSQSVVPKFGLVSPARAGGTMTVRYFMPWKTHASLAVTASQCFSGCVLAPNTVTDDMVDVPTVDSPVTITLEHPLGTMDVIVDYKCGDDFQIVSAGLVRTARKLASGHVFVPQDI